MSARRPGDRILLAPMPPDEALSLRVHLRRDYPPAYVPTDPLSWFWLSQIIIESPAPMPPRIFGGMPRIFAESALADPAGVGRS
jgi:hypothetical protein